MKVRNWLLSLLCLSALAPSAYAISKENALTFTLGGGYMFYSQKRDIHNTVVPGMAALSYNFTEKWAAAFSASQISTDSGDPSKHHVRGYAYILDSLYRFNDFHKFEPYIMGGLNVISLKPISSQPVNQGGANIGIGTQFLKSQGIALMVEAHDLYTFSGGKNDVLLTGGVNFLWE